MYRLSHRNIGLLICCYRGSLILGIMHVYLTAHMREGISARPGVTGGVTGSGGTSNTPSVASIGLLAVRDALVAIRPFSEAPSDPFTSQTALLRPIPLDW